MKSTFFVCLILLGLTLNGCKKETPHKQEPEKSTSLPAAPQPKPATPDAVPSESVPDTKVFDGIPTEEDYEEEAAQTITADNLEAELDKLEAEIGAN
jgi:hypothetical protein